MIYDLVRRLLFALDAEDAHELTVAHIRRLQSIPIVLRTIERACAIPPAAARTVWGLRFRSPIGIAAGFDKNAVMMPFLAALGFGFLEVGTVTLHPQPGNPRPRVFRYPEHRALVNRLGFNNDGADAVAERLHRWRSGGGLQPPLFVNVGKNRDVAIDAAGEAYAQCYLKVARWADGCVLNLSSPNTPSLRDLQRPEHLERLLELVRTVREEMTFDRPGLHPILVKIAPDLDDEQIREIADVCERLADGMVCTNTTVHRLPDMAESGGMSGSPLLGRSNGVLVKTNRVVGESIPIIGVGGVFTSDEARMKLAMGAKLVQVYTGFIYEGPAMPSRLARALSA